MRGNRIIPTIGNLGMHKLYMADAKSSFGRRQTRWWLAPSTNPARRPHRGPLSRFPLGDDKTGVDDARESAGQIDKVGFQTNCRDGICACGFVVCRNARAVRSLNLKRKVDAFWPNALGSRPQALLEFGVLFHQSFCQ